MNFAPNGDLYVLDSGFPSFQPGVPTLPIEVWRVEQNGQKSKVYSSAAGGPGALKGVALGIYAMDDDNIFVNDGQGLNRIRRDGSAQLVLKLPTEGDHNADHIVRGRDGKLYWGQGSATNSAVVGEDNELLTGWLKQNPTYRDIPCKDVTLTGKNYTSRNIIGPDPNATIETGPFLQFGTRASPGQVVQGQVPCTSSILRANPDGSGLEMVAWGFRNPFGLAFSPDDSPLRGALVVTNNGTDVRGSRPVENDGDDLYVITEGGWYGWPDILDELPITEPRFAPQGAQRIDPLLQSPSREDALSAITHFEKGVSTDGLDFSRSDGFGFKNDAFIALWGSLGFGVNPPDPPGFNVTRVSFETGPGGVVTGATTSVFASNKRQGAAAATGQNGFEHPVDVKFSPDGNTMYVLDFGVVAGQGTGRVWAIKKGP
jgi:glucose/arabinose dehydrogenase